MKARAAFEDSDIDISLEVDARKEVLAGDQAWEVINGVDTVYVASGRKTIEFDPLTADRDELMKKVTGRNGNLRAPSVRKKNVLYVGYNQEMYDELSR